MRSARWVVAVHHPFLAFFHRNSEFLHRTRGVITWAGTCAAPACPQFQYRMIACPPPCTHYRLRGIMAL
jgi:hypothetical protein